MKILAVIGTRPEIIKVAPIINLLKKSQLEIVYTNQHYDYNLGLKFFEELNIRKPDHKFKIVKNNPSLQISEIIKKLTPILEEIKPDSVMVQGDTNTSLAAAMCAIKSKINLNHVEAGLRSFDWRMPEEHNRIMIDHISNYLFAPTNRSKNQLKKENVFGKIFVAGNTSIDAIRVFHKLADKKSKIKIPENDFALATIHRAENVDNVKILSTIINSIIELPIQVFFPIHPRTSLRLKQFGLYDKIASSKNIIISDVVGYLDLIKLMKKSLFIISDSGGIQEESTAKEIRKKVIVVRKTSDRPEAVESGFSLIPGIRKKLILKAVEDVINSPKIKSQQNPFGIGNSSSRIISILKNELS